jgi:hypothetical protein
VQNRGFASANLASAPEPAPAKATCLGVPALRPTGYILRRDQCGCHGGR